MSAIKGIYETVPCLTAKLVPCIFNRASWQEINRLWVHPGQLLVSNSPCISNTSNCLINTPGQVYRAAHLAKRRLSAKRRIKQQCLGLRRLLPRKGRIPESPSHSPRLCDPSSSTSSSLAAPVLSRKMCGGFPPSFPKYHK